MSPLARLLNPQALLEPLVSLGSLRYLHCLYRLCRLCKLTVPVYNCCQSETVASLRLLPVCVGTGGCPQRYFSRATLAFLA